MSLNGTGGVNMLDVRSLAYVLNRTGLRTVV